MIMYVHVCNMCGFEETKFPRLPNLKCKKCNSSVTIREEGK